MLSFYVLCIDMLMLRFSWRNRGQMGQPTLRRWRCMTSTWCLKNVVWLISRWPPMMWTDPQMSRQGMRQTAWTSNTRPTQSTNPTRFSRRMWNRPTLAAFSTTRPWRTQSICSWSGASWQLKKIYNVWIFFSCGTILKFFYRWDEQLGRNASLRQRKGARTSQTIMVCTRWWLYNGSQHGVWNRLREQLSPDWWEVERLAHIALLGSSSALKGAFGVLSQHTRCFWGYRSSDAIGEKCFTLLGMVWLYGMLFIFYPRSRLHLAAWVCP